VFDINVGNTDTRLTVRFEAPVRGGDLVEAVRASAGGVDPDRYSDAAPFVRQGYDDGEVYLLGQRSVYDQNQNLLVTPSKASAVIHADERYDEVVVIRHDEPISRPELSSNVVSHERGLAAARAFAARLEQRVRERQQGGTGLARDPYAPAAAAVANPPESVQSRTRTMHPGGAGQPRVSEGRT
jgi:hypothetical protein